MRIRNLLRGSADRSARSLRQGSVGPAPQAPQSRQGGRNAWSPRLSARLLIPAAAVGLVATVPPITDDDDGAATRESGSVVIIGPPPPGGGASVSAVGSGCTTQGATTKLSTENIVIDIDDGVIEVPEIGAGVNRIVVRNFDSVPHGLVLTELHSVADLPLTDDGFVDEEALPNQVFRIAEFAGNTICEGTFELLPGDYVVFSPSPEDQSAVEAGTESDVEAGLATSIVIADHDTDAVGSETSSPAGTASTAGSTVAG